LIPGIEGSRTGRLLALASRDPARCRSWCEEFGIPKSCGSYERVLEDPEIEAVYIPLPNELHKPWVLAAADAGKHVLCEKPLALDAAEARVMVEHCRARGVLLMEAFMWRHQTRSQELRRLVAAGEIGALRLVRSSFSFPIEPNDWRLDPSRGGGALWDVGCYGVSTARFFTAAEPSKVAALARRGSTGVDMTFTAVLEFPGGVLASVDCSFEQPFRCQYELVGTEGLIEVPDAYLPPADAPPAARLVRLRARSDSSTVGSELKVMEFERADQYAAMVDAFGDSISAGALADPAEDGLAQMAAIEQLLKAAAL
jgi:predicted dehydrogenase